MISTGTTFHKMLATGIRPDYVMVTDPNDRVIFQLRENEEETIPMILLSTANRQFIQKYHGKIPDLSEWVQTCRRICNKK